MVGAISRGMWNGDMSKIKFMSSRIVDSACDVVSYYCDNWVIRYVPQFVPSIHSLCTFHNCFLPTSWYRLISRDATGKLQVWRIIMSYTMPWNWCLRRNHLHRDEKKLHKRKQRAKFSSFMALIRFCHTPNTNFMLRLLFLGLLL